MDNMPKYAPLDTDDLHDIEHGAQDGSYRLGISADDPLSAAQILNAVDSFIQQQCSAGPTIGVEDEGSGTDAIEDEEPDDVEALAFELGCLWGQQLVSSLGWRWVRVEFDSPSVEAVGVASADASLVIYPFQTIFLYYERVLPVRVARSYDILRQPGRVPMQPPAGLENVMDHID